MISFQLLMDFDYSRDRGPAVLCLWCGRPATHPLLDIGAARPVDACDEHYRTVVQPAYQAVEALREERLRKQRLARGATK